MAKYTAIDIAKYIINKCTLDGVPISNLQLQKMLFYVQKHFLQTSSALFDDDFEAWQFGPVIPSVYYQYCGHGAVPIKMIYPIKLENLNRDEIENIDNIINEKRIKNPWDLVMETHKKGGAWYRTYDNGFGNRDIIPKDNIRLYG